MTKTKEEIYDELCDRDDNKCQVCNKPITKRQGQFGHRIGQGKLSRRKYGDYIIDHPINKLLTCSLRCNQKVDISNSMLGIIGVLQEIIEYDQLNKFK